MVPPQPNVAKAPVAQPKAPAKKPVAQKGIKIGLPEGIDQIDIENPEHEGLLRSITYCDHRLQQIQGLMKTKMAKGERLTDHEKETMRNCTKIKA